MEARDSRSKVRPLPVDDIDGAAPQDRHDEPPRRWLPLVGIVLGAIAFGVIARGLGPAASSPVGNATTTTTVLSARPEATTTTEAPPPEAEPLSRLFPPAATGLRLIFMSPTSARIATWEPGALAPTSSTQMNQPKTATYNADGSRVAILTGVRGGSVGIDSAAGGNGVFLQERMSGVQWHPTDPDLLAWTQYSADAAVTLLRYTDVTGLSGDPTQTRFQATLPGRQHELVAWGDWGFVTRDAGARLGRRMTLFDADGLNPLQLEGQFFGATVDGVLLMARPDDNGLMPYLIEVDRSETGLVGLDIGAVDFRITSDGAWVIAVTEQVDGHTSLLARTVHSRSTRLTSIDGTARIVAISRDDRYIILQELESAELVFKNWNTGAEFHLPIDGDRDVAAVAF